MEPPRILLSSGPMGTFVEELSKKRSLLATCVKTEGVKVVPIKSFFHPRRSTALHTSLKVAWTSKTLIHQLTMQAHLIRITFRLKKTAADNKSSYQTPEVLNTATDR